MNILVFAIILQSCLVDCTHGQSCQVEGSHHQRDLHGHINEAFLDISQGNFSTSTLKKLDDFANSLSADEKTFFSHQISSIQRIIFSGELKTGDSDFLDKLDVYLKSIDVDEGIVHYLLCNIYDRLSRYSNDERFSIKSEENVKKSAQAGFEQAIIKWGECLLRNHGDSVDVKECIGLLISTKGYKNNKKAMLIISLFAVTYHDIKFENISLTDALQFIFDNKNYIVSSIIHYKGEKYEIIDSLYLNALLKSSLIYLMKGPFHDEQKAIILLKKFIPQTESIDVLLRLIYASDSIAPELKAVSALCLNRIESLLEGQDKRGLGSSYLSERGLATRENLKQLNKEPTLMVTKFIELSLSHLRASLEKKQINLFDLFSEIDS